MERDKEIENLFYVFTVPPKVTEISASGGNPGGGGHKDLGRKKRKYDWDEIYENSKNVSTPYEPRIPSNPFSYKVNIFNTNKMPSTGLNLSIKPIEPIKGISSQGIEPKLEKKSYFDTLESVLPKSGISSQEAFSKSSLNLKKEAVDGKSWKIFDESKGGAPLLRVDYEAHHGKPPAHLQYDKSFYTGRHGEEAFETFVDVFLKTKIPIKLFGKPKDGKDKN